MFCALWTCILWTFICNISQLMGPIWGWQDPGGSHVGPMNFAIWDSIKIDRLMKFIFEWKHPFKWSDICTIFKYQRCLIIVELLTCTSRLSHNGLPNLFHVLYKVCSAQAQNVNLWTSRVLRTKYELTTWAPCQIRKIADCACAGNAGNGFPTTDFKGNCKLTISTCITARASRTCRDARRDR